MAEKPKAKIRKGWIAVSVLTVLAGVVYNSWPLGYVLNPRVGTRGLASELEAINQPYNWLFTTMDVVSGVCIALAAYIIWRMRRDRRNKWLITVLSFYALFGIGTLVDALLPMHCDPSVSTHCPGIGQDHLLLAHGIASIAASVFLFLSVVLIWYRHHNIGQTILMTTMLGAWALFGLMSLIFFFVPGPGNLSQHYYITLCSVWIIIFPYTIGRPARKHKELFKQV